jgi:hypothetical protein
MEVSVIEEVAATPAELVVTAADCGLRSSRKERVPAA